MAKPGELGVLDSYEEIESGLAGMRKALRSTDRERGIKDALNNVRDLETVLRKSRRDADKLQKKTKSIIDDLTNKVLPLIKKQPKKKKRGGGGR
jgi:hypothetical protein